MKHTFLVLISLTMGFLCAYSIFSGSKKTEQKEPGTETVAQTENNEKTAKGKKTEVKISKKQWGVPICTRQIIDGPLILGVTQTSAVIMFEVTGNFRCRVLYGKKKTSAENSTLSRKDILPFKVEADPIYYSTEELFVAKVKLNNLEPDTEYQYRICFASSREQEGGTFRTPSFKSQPFQALILGNTASVFSLPNKLFPEDTAIIARAMSKHSQDTDLLLFTGKAACRDKLRFWKRELLRPFAEILRNTPIYSLRSNLEILDTCFGPFLKAENGIDEPFKDTFSVNWSGTQIIGLYVGSWPTADKELDWLEKELAKAKEQKRDWTIVLCNLKLPEKGRVIELLNRYDVPLFIFSGPGYERFQLEKLKTVVVQNGGGGGFLGEIKKPEDYASKIPHFCLVKVDKDDISFKVTTAEGKKLDIFRITKTGRKGQFEVKKE